MKEKIQELIDKLEEDLKDMRKFSMNASRIEDKKQIIKDLQSILSISQPDEGVKQKQ